MSLFEHGVCYLSKVKDPFTVALWFLLTSICSDWCLPLGLACTRQAELIEADHVVVSGMLHLLTQASSTTCCQITYGRALYCSWVSSPTTPHLTPRNISHLVAWTSAMGGRCTLLCVWHSAGHADAITMHTPYLTPVGLHF